MIAVVITDRELSVLASSPEADGISPRGAIRQGDNLLDHIPSLQKVLTNEVMTIGSERIALEDLPMAVRVLAVGNYLTFEFVSGADPGDDLAAIRHKNAFLEKVFEEAPIGIIFVDKDETVFGFNKQQEKNSRVSRDLVLGKRLGDIFGKAYQDNVVTKAHWALLRGEKKEVTIRLDHYLPQFYNKEMTFRISGRHLGEDLGTAIFSEIEQDLYREMRKAEKRGDELRRSRKYLAAILDASPNIVISVDNQRRILSFNRTAELILGYPASQVLNKPVDPLFTTDDLTSLHEAIAAPGHWYGAAHLVKWDKTSMLTELIATKIKEDRTGKEIATLLLAKDIEETNQLRKNLIQSQKMNFLGEIMGGLAHQLNNPLVGVVNIAEVLLHTLDPQDDGYAYVRMIKEAGETCREVIARLLKFSRRSDMSPPVIIDIRDVINAGLDLIARHDLFKQVKLEKHLYETPLIHGDPVLLQQAFMNIFWNAAQAVDGGGTLNVTCTFRDGMNREVEVIIADNGIGIPKENIPKIFDPFFTTKEADKGTGLGLSLAYWIIKDHGGRIIVESEVGQGTTMHAFLPAIRM